MEEQVGSKGIWNLVKLADKLDRWQTRSPSKNNWPTKIILSIVQDLEPSLHVFDVGKRISLYLARTSPQQTIDHLNYEITQLIEADDEPVTAHKPASLSVPIHFCTQTMTKNSLTQPITVVLLSSKNSICKTSARQDFVEPQKGSVGNGRTWTVSLITLFKNFFVGQWVLSCIVDLEVPQWFSFHGLLWLIKSFQRAREVWYVGIWVLWLRKVH